MRKMLGVMSWIGALVMAIGAVRWLFGTVNEENASAIVGFAEEIAAELQFLAGALICTVILGAEMLRAALSGIERPPITMSSIFEKKTDDGDH